MIFLTLWDIRVSNTLFTSLEQRDLGQDPISDNMIVTYIFIIKSLFYDTYSSSKQKYK